MERIKYRFIVYNKLWSNPKMNLFVTNPQFNNIHALAHLYTGVHPWMESELVSRWQNSVKLSLRIQSTSDGTTTKMLTKHVFFDSFCHFVSRCGLNLMWREEKLTSWKQYQKLKLTLLVGRSAAWLPAKLNLFLSHSEMHIMTREREIERLFSFLCILSWQSYDIIWLDCNLHLWSGCLLCGLARQLVWPTQNISPPHAMRLYNLQACFRLTTKWFVREFG